MRRRLKPPSALSQRCLNGGLPAAQALPYLHISVMQNGDVATKLRARRARMVGQNAQARAEWEVRDHIHMAMLKPRHTVFLIGAAEQQPVDGLTVFITHLAIPEIKFLRLSATIPTHGHPARIGDDPAFPLDGQSPLSARSRPVHRHGTRRCCASPGRRTHTRQRAVR